MLTVDFQRLPAMDGARLLDLGCGAGRHAFEAARRGARVVALDTAHAELEQVLAVAAAMSEASEVPVGAALAPAAGDATAMPFADDSFDVVIAAEVLEHIPADQNAISEITRVLRPGVAARAHLLAAVRRLPQCAWRAHSDLYQVRAGDKAAAGRPCR